MEYNDSQSHLATFDGTISILVGILVAVSQKMKLRMKLKLPKNLTITKKQNVRPVSASAALTEDSLFRRNEISLVSVVITASLFNLAFLTSNFVAADSIEDNDCPEHPTINWTSVYLESNVRPLESKSYQNNFQEYDFQEISFFHSFLRCYVAWKKRAGFLNPLKIVFLKFVLISFFPLVK